MPRPTAEQIARRRLDVIWSPDLLAYVTLRAALERFAREAERVTIAPAPSKKAALQNQLPHS